MGLSKRERTLAIAALIGVGILLVYSLIIKPVKSGLEQTENYKLDLQAQVTKAHNLIERRKVMEQKWKTMLSDGLRSDAEAESRVAKALEKWSADARLMLTSVKPDRRGGDKGLKEITFVLAGSGRLDAVAWFLYQVETSELPIKVKEMRLGSTSESGDNMSLQLRLSALYLDSTEKSSEKQPQPNRQETNNEEQLL